MSEKQNSIFDANYVGGEHTSTAIQPKLSEMKEFLKAPISGEDIERYGTSKPYREVIRAAIQYGKSK